MKTAGWVGEGIVHLHKTGMGAMEWSEGDAKQKQGGVGRTRLCVLSFVYFLSLRPPPPPINQASIRSTSLGKLVRPLPFANLTDLDNIRYRSGHFSGYGGRIGNPCFHFHQSS